VTLDERGKLFDSCTSGLVRWTAGTLAAGAASPVVVPANEQIGGLTHAQWEARAWQWDNAYVRSHHSSAPTTVPCVSKGQSGPVWFLRHDTYDFGSRPFTVTCSVPVGRYVLIDYPGVECSTVERPPYYAKTDAGLVRCAQAFRRPSSALAFDGQTISPSGVVVTTSPFSFSMPPRNNYLEVNGATHGRAAYHGQVLILEPLTPVSHTLVRVDRYAGGMLRTTTYEITSR
jgi:hypothetical protein